MVGSFFSVLWMIIIVSSLLSPLFSRRKTELGRIRLLNSLSRKRGSRVISMIHRMEAFSFLGIPLSRHIDIEDSEQVLRAIRRTPKDVPIDIILHTPGGLVLAAEQIARAIAGHEAKVTVFVPHYAMSGGTLLALAADEIIMDEHAVLGPIDPQLGNYPAVSILRAIEQKDKIHWTTVHSYWVTWLQKPWFKSTTASITCCARSFLKIKQERLQES